VSPGAHANGLRVIITDTRLEAGVASGRRKLDGLGAVARSGGV
jgi:hypothetical protein